MQLDKLETANFKYDNSIFKILRQKYPHEALLFPNLSSFIISRNFSIRQIRGWWLKLWQFFFQISAPKYPNKAFLVPNFKHFCFFRGILLLGKFEGAKSFCKVLAQNYPHEPFLVPSLGIFIVSWNFAIKQIRGCWIQI